MIIIDKQDWEIYQKSLIQQLCSVKMELKYNEKRKTTDMLTLGNGSSVSVMQLIEGLKKTIIVLEDKILITNELKNL